MPSSKVSKGVNDLETMFPEIAKEADGWDPSTVRFGSHKKMRWKCSDHGHCWERTVNQRTSHTGRGCPYCAGKRVWKGFNDLKTKFPEIAAEADGWDPSLVTFGSSEIKAWKCNEHGHTWDVGIYARTSHGGRGCPFCAGQKVWVGFNDLKSQFPEIAAEADGWDPSSVTPGSSREKKSWKCKSHGHTWDATPKSRTTEGSNCPYCANYLIWKGFNDLKSKFPEIAAEADGWDPSTIGVGTDKKMLWKCKHYGHSWKATVVGRTSRNHGCPYCSNSKLLVGFNDLKTRFPDFAKQANGWDPSTVLAGSTKRKPWKCEKGHTWKVSPAQRINYKTGCPDCAETGFNPGKPAWFYLLQRPGEQQFGITNVLSERLKTHARDNWEVVETTGPHPGERVQATEDELKKWIKQKVGLIPHKQENWYTSKMEVHSLLELKKKSGIETSIF